MSARLYVEGGGDSKALQTACRKGFSELLRKAGLNGRLPSIFAAGSRARAYDAFNTAMRDSAKRGTPFLLVDSEGPVRHTSPWEHVRNRQGDQWARPDGASDEQFHLMVQCMESWFLADRATLQAFFGQGFTANALPGNPNIEQIGKPQLFEALAAAVRPTKKEHYAKGRDSFELLARLDPTKIREASHWANRFFDTLDRLTR